MLTHTFCHIPGIGPATERKLWGCGIFSWSDFLQAYPHVPLSAGKREQVKEYLERSVNALEGGDHEFFAQRLKAHDSWRAFSEFSDSSVYLDIETTGLGGAAKITMIGLYDGESYQPYVMGHNLADFPAVIAEYSLIITYYGTGFDLPFILQRFPSLKFPQIHIDLCFALRRLGYKGGLKHIEEQLGIERSEGTRGLSGHDAVRLWHEYKRGKDSSLELLIKYNREDVVNLKRLMQFSYGKLVEGSGFPID